MLMYNNEMFLEECLTTLGEIGFKKGSGTTRLSYSLEYYQGRDYVASLMEKSGLETKVDEVGNLIGRWEGNSPDTILMGSHIDTVPNGGMFDGALGVIAGIACIRQLKHMGYQSQHSIEIAAFVEEEGNVIGGCLGSRWFTGARLSDQDHDKLKEHGLQVRRLQKSAHLLQDYQCYLELHVEQGGILESRAKTIGIVESIVGIMRFQVTVTGVANHAGSTPMHMRKDAFATTCQFANELYAEVRRTPDMVATIGDILIPEGAANVIPGEVNFVLEMRHSCTERMIQVLESVCLHYPDIQLVPILNDPPTHMALPLIQSIETICREHNISYMHMQSGAGHDAIYLAQKMPAAMIFIPSVGGISHSIREYSYPEDVYVGAKLLRELVIHIDQKWERGLKG